MSKHTLQALTCKFWLLYVDGEEFTTVAASAITVGKQKDITTKYLALFYYYSSFSLLNIS